MQPSDGTKEQVGSPMPFFTIVSEFGGGTFISQVRARNVATALRKWVHALGSDSTPDRLSSREREVLLTDVDDQPATLIQGLEGVWCFSSLLRKKLWLVHVVLTAN